MRIVLLAIVLLLAGCAGESAGSSGPGPQVGTYEATGEGGDSAELAGKLIVRGGCFLVETDSAAYLPLFPAGHTSAPDDETLKYDDETFKTGEAISLRGSAARESSDFLNTATLPDCKAGSHGYWTVAQHD